MDRITKSYLKEFLRVNEIQPSDDETIDFEKFVNFSIIGNEYEGKFELSDISTGNHAQGIDGIATIVNGKLVTSEEEIDDLLAMNKYLEVLFVFIQTKTSEKFEGTQIGNFIFSIKDFFSESPDLPMNESVKNANGLSKKIYDNSHKLIKGRPILKMYYVTTGIWNNEISHQAVIKNGIKELTATNLFGKITFDPIDASGIQNKYRKTKELTNATFIFKEKITLPEITDIKESYYGILPWSEFKKILINENGNIKNIFYDNVRDYLGDNPVNDSIEHTIQNRKLDLFTVLNNGVTMVASDLETAGNKFTITDYQIVNGCQTSHVLFDNKIVDGLDNLIVPVRLIVTANENIKNEITIATNNQTAIKPEQLEALSQFQKGLEEYYRSFEEESTKLYYERRANQYSSDDAVIKSRIVTVPQQIKTFAAMFLELPHAVSGYFGTIMKNHGKNIFSNGHIYFPYYISSLAFYKLDSYFRLGVLDKKYMKSKFHILLLFRFIATDGQAVPPLDQKRKAEPYSKKMYDILINDSKAKQIFEACINVIDKAGIALDDKDIFKQGETTKKELDYLRKS